MSDPRGPARGLLFAAVIVTVACGEMVPTPPPTEPGPMAAALFELSLADEPGPERLDPLFGPMEPGQGRAALLDALEALDVGARPRVLQEDRVEGLGRAVVDIVVDLPGGGAAHYSVQLERPRDGGWRVIWFRGPGVQWPAHSKGKQSGLSSSSTGG